MPKEPENLVLKMLREMRAVQDQHTTEFARLHRDISDWKGTSAQSAGFAMHANVALNAVREELQGLDKRLKRLEKKA